MEKKVSILTVGICVSLLIGYSMTYANSTSADLVDSAVDSEDTNVTAFLSEKFGYTSSAEQFVIDMRMKLNSVGIQVDTDSLPTEQAVLALSDAYFQFIDNLAQQDASQQRNEQQTAEQQTAEQQSTEQQFTSEYNPNSEIEQYQNKLLSVGVNVNLEGLTEEEALIALRTAYTNYIESINAPVPISPYTVIQDLKSPEYVIQFQEKMRGLGVEVNIDGLSTEQALVVLQTAYFAYITSEYAQIPDSGSLTAEENTAQYVNNLQTKLRSVGVEVNLSGLSMEQSLEKLNQAYDNFINSK
jgi:hypothetical protein